MANFDQVYNFIAKNSFSRQVTKMTRDMGKFTSKIGKSTKELLKNKQRMKELGTSIRNAGLKMTAFATLPIALLGRSMINAASDAVETRNKFNEVFKGIETQGAAAVADLSDKFKLASSTSQELLSDTGDLLKGLGLTPKVALEMSKQVVALSADVASFKNVQGGAARTSNALTKALLGEREMLKETFKTAVLENEVMAIAKDLRKKNRTLTLQQAKAIAVLTIVTTRNKDAIGDFARTQAEYANQTRIASERTKELREKMGMLLLPIATKVVGIMIKLVDWMNNLSPAMKKAILIVGGLVAVIGPLALALGGLIAIAPAMAAAFGIMFGPIGLAVTAVAAVIVGLKKISDLRKKEEEKEEGPKVRGGRRSRKALSEQKKLEDTLFKRIQRGEFLSDDQEQAGRRGRRGRRELAEAIPAERSAIEGAVDINVKSDPGTVSSVRTRRKRGIRLNTGTNMASA